MTKKEICYLKMLLYCWIFKGILIGIFGDTFLWVFFSVCFPRVYVWIKSNEWNEIQILAVHKVYVLFTPKLVWKHFEKYYFFLKCKVYCCSLYVNIGKEVREKSSYAACVSLVFTNSPYAYFLPSNTLNTNLLYLYVGASNHTKDPAQIKRMFNTGLLFSNFFIIP